jgi:phage shock protein A
MFKPLVTLLRGAAHETGAAVTRRHALLLLDQQIRDSGAAIEAGRRALAGAVAARRQEDDQARAISARIAGLEDRARAALAGGREDLALLAAETIATLEPERDAAGQARAVLAGEITRLRRAVEDAQARHAALRRGRRQAGLGHAAGVVVTTALREAEDTLAALQTRQAAQEALAEMTADPEDRLGEAGFGPAARPTAAAVLARLKPLAIART